MTWEDTTMTHTKRNDIDVQIDGFSQRIQITLDNGKTYITIGLNDAQELLAIMSKRDRSYSVTLKSIAGDYRALWLSPVALGPKVSQPAFCIQHTPTAVYSLLSDECVNQLYRLLGRIVVKLISSSTPDVSDSVAESDPLAGANRRRDENLQSIFG
jgi:hypothetical protein